jgi:IS30 family transposase
MIKVLQMSLNQLFNTDAKYDNNYNLLKSKARVPAKYQEFKLNNKNEIYYEPTKAIVIKRSESQEFLKSLYEKERLQLIGKGIRTFYKYINERYINITYKDVTEFLKKQENYQLTSDINKVVNKPIIEKRPNARWQIDLIDMSNYGQQNKKKYILNCVDVFSRKIWLRPLKDKTAMLSSDALINIIEVADVKPDIIQTDNGGEFLAQFNQYCKDNEIKHIFSTSYTPNDNAIVERSNKEVRKIIRAIMVENINSKWDNILQDVEDNINNSYHSTIKTYPNKIWINNTNKISIRNFPKTLINNNPKLKALDNIITTSEKKIKKYKELDDYEVGDIVRVKMSSIFTNVRKLLKSKDSKQIVVSYTPEKFIISKVTNKHGTLERKRYMLENADEFVLKNHKGNNKYFYASELIESNGDEDFNINMDDALDLNKVKRNESDVIYEE